MKGGAASLAIVIILVAAGFGVSNLTHSPVTTPTFTPTNTSTAQPANILKDKTITLNDFVSLIETEYVTGSAFGLLGTCTTIVMQNVTMLLPANPTGASSMHVSTGRVDLCPVSYGLAGVSFSFNGHATANGADLTQLVLTYAPPAATTTTTRTTSS